MSRSRTFALVGAAALLLVSGAPIAAQDDEPTHSAMEAEGLTVEVVGVEYAYRGLPTSLPAGSELTFRNDGADVHEMVVVRVTDDTTETLEELLAMDAEGRNPVNEGLVEFISGQPFVAAPGTTVEGRVPLDREGRYIALCFIPQGLTDVSILQSLGSGRDLAGAPPEVQAIMANPPHYSLGMIQEFAVTAEGTEVGPMPVEEPRATAATPEEAVVPAEAVVTAIEQLDERTVDLTIASPSVGEAKVRLLLPARFEEDPNASWPVLLLLHGQGDSHTSWTTDSDVADLTSDLDLLVVMPDGGSGWYSDWWNGGEGGPPAWETFHLDEVLGIVERDWRASDRRIVAGLSMGGFGAMHYATARPELFQAAASFSGVVDPVGSGFFHDYRLWGNQEEQADIWAAHDPVAMANALEGKSLFLSWQDGQPGPLDHPDASFDDLEAWVAGQNEALVARLAGLGIDAVTESGPGTHSWPYWEQSLDHALPELLQAVTE
jgi:S-formylglutathione hydrolase FrmB